MRITIIGAGMLAVTALSTIVLTPGVAAADDYAGQKYSDVVSKLGDSDLAGVIATRAGDLVDDDDCVVSSSEKAPWLKGDDFAPVPETVVQSLDYAYDLVGNVRSVADPLGADRTFTYDARYRLLTATGRESDGTPATPTKSESKSRTTPSVATSTGSGSASAPRIWPSRTTRLRAR